MSQGDLFYELFLGDFCLGPQCQYECKYKMAKSSADLRIGDLWGKTYSNNEKGVSALLAITEKGRKITEALKDVTLVGHSLSAVTEGQMKENARRKPFSNLIMDYLKAGYPIDTIYFKTLLFVLKVFARLKRVFER